MQRRKPEGTAMPMTIEEYEAYRQEQEQQREAAASEAQSAHEREIELQTVADTSGEPAYAAPDEQNQQEEQYYAADEAEYDRPVKVKTTLAGTIDEAKEKIGRKIGTLVWLAWILAVIAGGISGFGVGAILPLIILNLMLVSPKLVYRITEIILDFFGVGEWLQYFDMVASNVPVQINIIQKLVIVLIDILFILFIALVLSLMLMAMCTALSGGFFKQAIVWAMSHFSDTIASLVNMCKKIQAK